MRRLGIALAACMLSASAAAVAPIARSRGYELADELDVKRLRSALGFSTAPTDRRSKNAPTKRRLKRNRLHLSRRTRRRHRRAA